MGTLYAEARTKILSCISQSSPSEARLVLSADLLEAQNLVRFIQDSFNSLSPALRLPNEIWIDIGWFVFDSCEDSWSSKKQSLLTTFLPLTHICRSLRHLFHSTPSFWTHVDLKSPAMKLLLQLSGSLKIRVTSNAVNFREMRPMWLDEEDCWEDHCDSNPIQNDASRAVIKAKTRERVEQILLAADHRTISKCLQQWDVSAFPQLHRVTLHVIEADDLDDLQMNDPVIRLRAPLDTLQLHGVLPRLPPSSCTSLRHLTLSSAYESGTMGMLEFMRLLLQCKSLEELQILEALEVDSPLEFSHSPRPNRATVPLNNLKSLTISNTLDVIQFLLRAIEFPMLQNLFLHIEPYDPFSRLLADLVPQSHPFYQSIMELKTLAVRCIRGKVVVSTFDDLFTTQQTAGGESGEFTFKAEFSGLPEEDEDEFHSLDTLFSFIGTGYTNQICEDLLVEIEMEVDDVLDNDTDEVWLTLFLMLPNIRRLRFHFKGSQPLVQTILSFTPKDLEIPQFAHLEEIHLSVQSGLDSDVESYGLDWDEVELLEDMLRSRHRAHSPLITLRFDTNVSPEEPAFGMFTKEAKKFVQNIIVTHHSEDIDPGLAQVSKTIVY